MSIWASRKNYFSPGRVLLILWAFGSSTAFSQNIDPPQPADDINSIHLGVENPVTHEQGSVTIQTMNLGNLQDASQDELNAIAKDLRENATGEHGDGTLTIFREEGDQESPPVILTQGLDVANYIIPATAIRAQNKLETYAESKSSVQPVSFGRRKWNGLKAAFGETTVNDWVMGVVLFATPRAIIQFCFMTKEHAIGYSIFWASAVALTTISNNVFHKSLDNWATQGTQNPNRSLFNEDRAKIWYKFWKWDLVTDVLLNFISKRNTLSQLFLDTFPRLTNNFVSVQKALLFKNNRNLRITYTVVPLVAMTVIQAINNCIHQNAIWTWQLGHSQLLDALNLSNYKIWELRPTTIMSLVAYGILLGANAVAPDWVTKKVVNLESKIMPKVDWMAKAIIRVLNLKITPTDPCRKILDRNSPDSKADESFVADELHGT